MFILFGDNRVNSSTIHRYNPYDGEFDGVPYYSVVFKFFDLDKMETVFKTELERNEYINKLDQKLL